MNTQPATPTDDWDTDVNAPAFWLARALRRDGWIILGADQDPRPGAVQIVGNDAGGQDASSVTVRVCATRNAQDSGWLVQVMTREGALKDDARLSDFWDVTTVAHLMQQVLQ